MISKRDGSLKEFVVDSTGTFTYGTGTTNDLYTSGSGTYSPWLKVQSWPPAFAIRKSEREIRGATFPTLILTIEGTEHEVVWFEGEPIADVLERMAQSMR